jgi:CheY-like chemotaxis protein
MFGRLRMPFCPKVQIPPNLQRLYSDFTDGRDERGEKAKLQVQRYVSESLLGTRGGLVMSESSGVPVIAVIDDDKSVRESLAGFIESVGYEVALFSSAEEFSITGRIRNDLRCVILDVCLPGMSGLELYSQLTLSGWCVPAIFITGHANPAVARWANTPGVVKVLYKPFQPRVLLEAVRRAVTTLH